MPQPFKCPSCGGPLQYDGGDITIRCHYCTNSVIVPEELRAGPAFNAPPAPLPAQLHNLSEIGRLIRGGNKIAAIKLYRETFGTGLKEAKDAVENLAAGRPVEISQTIGTSGHVHFDPRQIANWPTPEVVATATKKGCSLLAVGIASIVLVTLFAIGFSIYLSQRKTAEDSTTTTTKPTIPSAPTQSGTATSGPKTTTPEFASLVLQAGSEGIGAGQFKDSRSIAVDGQGHIYMAEYTGGRVQVFDAEGKFITQWMVDAKMPLLQIAADRQGTVYVVQKSDITRYEGLTGKPIGKVQRAEGNGYYDDVFVTLDGGLVAVNRGEDIVTINASGQIVRTIKSAISEQSGDSELSARVAADGLGNIYALGRFNEAVFKFGPNGKYITRFGGKGSEAGQFRAPHAIAVDGQGRVYVADIKGIQVFDENGRYLGLFKLEKNLAFGMVFNDKNELFVAARTMLYKFAVNKQ
jgi:Ribosomal protein L7/L12 C-terminal domain